MIRQMRMSELGPIQLPRSQRKTQPWTNGAGVSHPVTSHLPSGIVDEVRWRINIADIPGDCTFSDLAGVDRLFMLLDDVELTLDLGSPRRVRPLETVQFAGEVAPDCRSSGPGQALNLLIRRGRAVGKLVLLDLAGPMDLPVPPGGCIVAVKIDGAPIWPGGVDLGRGDAVRLDRSLAGPPGTLPLSGNGRVAVISVVELPDEDAT